MKKIKVLALGLVLGIAGVAYAATGGVRSTETDAACCSMAGCCTDGACDMGGACCGSHGE